MKKGLHVDPSALGGSKLSNGQGACPLDESTRCSPLTLGGSSFSRFFPLIIIQTSSGAEGGANNYQRFYVAPWLTGLVARVNDVTPGAIKTPPKNPKPNDPLYRSVILYTNPINDLTIYTWTNNKGSHRWTGPCGSCLAGALRPRLKEMLQFHDFWL